MPGDRNLVDILIRARDDASKVISGVRGALGQLDRQTAGTRRAFGSLVGPSTVATVALTGAATAAAGMGLAAVALAGKLEQSEIAFETLLGSAEAAGAFLDELADFAAATPFDFQGLQNSSRLMLAFGFQADAVLPIVTALGDATSALGGSTAELEGVARALGQIQTKGKVSTEELLQLAERGIPVFQILQDKLGLTGEELGKIGELGIDASTGIAAILEGLTERFGGAMAKQSQTVLGLWSSVRDGVSLISMDIGKQLIDALDIKEALQRVLDGLDRARAWLADVDLATVWDDNRHAIELAAGALTGMMLPGLINAATATLRLVRPLAGMAIAGALAVDVATKLGVDWGALVQPNGVLPRVGSVLMGLVDIFSGVTTSLASLIQATVIGFQDWGEFLGETMNQLGATVGRLVDQVSLGSQVILAFQYGGLRDGIRKFEELQAFLRTPAPRMDLAGAWNDAFQGVPDSILDGFTDANLQLERGWGRIVDGFTNQVDAGTQQIVAGVSEAVSGSAKELINWAELLGKSTSEPLATTTSAADAATKALEDSGAAATTATSAWQSALQTAGLLAGGLARHAFGLDQPTNPWTALGRELVASLTAGFTNAFPEFGAIVTGAVQGLVDQHTARLEAERNEREQARAERQALHQRGVGQAAGDDARFGTPEARLAFTEHALGRPYVPPVDPAAQAEFVARLLDAAGKLAVRALQAAERGVRELDRDRRVVLATARVGQAAREAAMFGSEAARRAYSDALALDPRNAGLLRPLQPPGATATAGPATRLDPGAHAALPDARSLANAPIVELATGVPLAADVQVVIDSDRAGSLPAETYHQILQDELAARQAFVTGLTTMTTEQGPLANFAASLTNLAAQSVPAFGAALDGFVQAGPVGAIIAFLTQLLSQSEGFTKLIDAVNAALQPLAEALGAVLAALMPLIEPLLDLWQVTAAIVKVIAQILTPVFSVLGAVIGGIVSALISVWNFLLGWIPGLHIDPLEAPEAPPAPTAPTRPPMQHSPNAPTPEVQLGRFSPAAQFAIVTPLIEAANLQVSAGRTLEAAAGTIAGAFDKADQFFTRLLDEGIPIHLPPTSAAAAGSSTAYLR